MDPNYYLLLGRRPGQRQDYFRARLQRQPRHHRSIYFKRVHQHQSVTRRQLRCRPNALSLLVQSRVAANRDVWRRQGEPVGSLRQRRRGVRLEARRTHHGRNQPQLEPDRAQKWLLGLQSSELQHPKMVFVFLLRKQTTDEAALAQRRALRKS